MSTHFLSFSRIIRVLSFPFPSFLSVLARFFVVLVPSIWAFVGFIVGPEINHIEPLSLTGRVYPYLGFFLRLVFGLLVPVHFVVSGPDITGLGFQGTCWGSVHFFPLSGFK